jgi:hypothetical protein
MTTNIYIIRLEQNKYFIGEAVNLEKRLKDHSEGKVSQYTNIYRPISIKKIIPDSNPKHLDKYVIKYMEKYGMNMVRGGSFDNEVLSKDQIKYLKSQGVKEPQQQKQQQKQQQTQKSYEQPTLSLQEQQMIEQELYQQEIMQQPQKIMQRRRPESSLKQDVLKIPIRQANGTCFICGLDGHYQENCTRNQELRGYDNEEELEGLDMFFKPNLRS